MLKMWENMQGPLIIKAELPSSFQHLHAKRSHYYYLCTSKTYTEKNVALFLHKGFKVGRMSQLQINQSLTEIHLLSSV